MSRNLLIPLIVACALFMENMDSTVLSTSLPAIAADLGTEKLDDHLSLGVLLQIVLDPIGDAPDDLLVPGVVHDHGHIDLGPGQRR